MDTSHCNSFSLRQGGEFTVHQRKGEFIVVETLFLPTGEVFNANLEHTPTKRCNDNETRSARVFFPMGFSSPGTSGTKHFSTPDGLQPRTPRMPLSQEVLQRAVGGVNDSNLIPLELLFTYSVRIRSRNLINNEDATWERREPPY